MELSLSSSDFLFAVTGDLRHAFTRETESLEESFSSSEFLSAPIGDCRYNFVGEIESKEQLFSLDFLFVGDNSRLHTVARSEIKIQFINACNNHILSI